MRIAFVVNQIATEQSGYDTTLLAATAAQMGHEVYLIGLGGLGYDEDGCFYSRGVKAPKTRFKDLENFLRAIQGPEAEVVPVSSRDLDVLYLRSNPSEDQGERMWAQTAGITFGKIAVANGVLVLNDPSSLLDTLNKMYFQYFPEKVRPRTIITRNADDIKRFYERQGQKIILKPLQGSGGTDVFLLDDITNLNQIVEAITRNGFVIAQEYLTKAKGGDTRLIMMNGKAFQVEGKYAAIHRKNKGDDIRSNIHVGGRPVKAKITATMLELVDVLRPKILKDGMFMVGLDIVGDKIMELNLFSPGGLVSAEKAEGVCFARAMIEAIERKVDYKRYYGDKISNAALAVME